MQVYEVGKRYPALFHGTDGVTFLVNPGLSILVRIASPTRSELKAMKAGSNLGIASAIINGVIFVFVKFGDLEWFDAPFYPHINTVKPLPEFGNGLTILVGDPVTGELYSTRLIALPPLFCDNLQEQYKRIPEETITQKELFQKITGLYSRYTSEQLMKISKAETFLIRR